MKKSIKLVPPSGKAFEVTLRPITLGLRLKINEFERESQRMHDNSKKEIEQIYEDAQKAVAADSGNGAAVVTDTQAKTAEITRKTNTMWLIRVIEKAQILIDKAKLSSKEVTLVESAADGEFWCEQNLEEVAAFVSSF